MDNWLTRDQAKELLRVPDRTTRKGKRDYAVLALLVGCALRRRELAALDIADVQQREGRWVIADLVGKGNRIRTFAVPLWVQTAIDTWAGRSGAERGPLFPSGCERRQDLALESQRLGSVGHRAAVRRRDRYEELGCS